MHTSVLEFAKKIQPALVSGKRVLEVGSSDLNGSVRPIFERHNPESYIGVDCAPGKRVDTVCDAVDLVKKFGEESFDLVVSTEMLEHVVYWRRIISNLKRVCSTDGFLILTTRSKGFHYHPHPIDLWRYEREDFREIFRDMNIRILLSDWEVPGVFLVAQKPKRFEERDLSGIKLHRMPEATFLQKLPKGVAGAWGTRLGIKTR